MASKKKSTKTVTSAASIKVIEGALAGLADVASASAKAVVAVTKENKSLAAAAKRLGKKRSSLSKKKKSAAAKVKKESNAANKNALKSIDKELAVVKKEADKVKGQKATVSTELTGLKLASKRATAYAAALTKTDAILNKPKKKRRKKKAVKKVL